MVSGGLGLQRLEGFWFPGQKLRSGCHSESAEFSSLDQQGQWPVTRPLVCWLCRNEFHKEKGNSETSVYEEEKECVWIDRLSRLRIVSLWWFESLTQGISSRFPLANHLGLPGSESVFSLSQDCARFGSTYSLAQDPPMCAHISYSRWIQVKRPIGRLTSLPSDL